MKWMFLPILLSICATKVFAISQSNSDSVSTTNERLISGLKVQFGGNLNFNIKDQDANDPNIPDQFESIEERPSIASFFDPGVGIKTDISVGIELPQLQNSEIIVGINYYYTKFASSDRSAEELLGETLMANTFSPYIGYGQYSNEERTTFLYGFLGPSIKMFKGESTDGDFDIVHNYSSNGLFRAGLGIEIDEAKSPVFITFGFEFELGKIYIDELEAYRDGEFVDRVSVTGDNKLSAYSFLANISIGYKFLKK